MIVKSINGDNKSAIINRVDGPKNETGYEVILTHKKGEVDIMIINAFTLAHATSLAEKLVWGAKRETILSA